ncbi:hypothetical protein [Thermococcus peptonophilus]
MAELLGGPVRIPIIINGQIAGQLWEDVDLKEVEIGTYVQGDVGHQSSAP